MKEELIRYFVALDLLWSPGSAFHYVFDEIEETEACNEIQERSIKWYSLSSDLMEWEFDQYYLIQKREIALADKSEELYQLITKYGDALVIEGGAELHKAITTLHTAGVTPDLYKGVVLYFYYCAWYAQALRAFAKIAGEIATLFSDLQQSYNDVLPLYTDLVRLLDEETESLNTDPRFSVSDRDILRNDVLQQANQRATHWRDSVEEAVRNISNIM